MNLEKCDKCQGLYIVQTSLKPFDDDTGLKCKICSSRLCTECIYKCCDKCPKILCENCNDDCLCENCLNVPSSPRNNP